MAKIQVYKFVSPGAVGHLLQKLLARQSLLATNRLGSVISGIGSQVVDINKITNLRVKAADRSEIAERRKKKTDGCGGRKLSKNQLQVKRIYQIAFKKKSKIKYKKRILEVSLRIHLE
ncbi:MAG: hypothetical protein CM15mV34_0930 [Caudoviricetes sp.]|nr:MAG: hypothetical protein CM15mV34_0930 [Caudoviricetes sp.]